jgi:cupin fold WbuC family metalloprotein
MAKLFDKEFIDALLLAATKSLRLRQNHDLRNSDTDTSQRMLNALMPGTEVPIHQHENTSETVICLSGKIEEIIYDLESIIGNNGVVVNGNINTTDMGIHVNSIISNDAYGIYVNNNVESEFTSIHVGGDVISNKSAGSYSAISIDGSVTSIGMGIFIGGNVSASNNYGILVNGNVTTNYGAGI